MTDEVQHADVPTCSVCGREAKNLAGLASHMRSKHADPTPEPDINEDVKVLQQLSAAVPAKKGPAILKDNRRVHGKRLGYGHRSISMLRPICDICDDGDGTPQWYLACPHDPYMGVREERWEVPQYEDGPDGSKVLTGTETRSRFIAQPNWAEISVSNRINGGQGVGRARLKGFIRPSELRNELYPEGIAECCEWSDCKWQDGLRSYKNIEGRFCRPGEARLAAWDQRKVTGQRKAIEIGWNDDSREKREEQLDSVVLVEAN